MFRRQRERARVNRVNYDTLHKDMVDMRNLLNYPKSDAGLCQGSTISWIEAQLFNNGKLFNDACEKIQQNKLTLSQAISSAKEKTKLKQGLTVEEKNSFNILSFYDRIELFQSPQEHRGFFFNHLNQCDIDKISPIASSQTIVDAGGLCMILSASYIFSSNELLDYLEKVAKLLASLNNEKSMDNIAILLSNIGHGVGLIYNFHYQRWFSFMDINNGISNICDTKDLVEKIRSSLKQKYELALMTDNIQLETNKLYVCYKEGNLIYTVIDHFKKITTDKIELAQLKNILGSSANILEQESLDIVKLKDFLPQILDILSARGDINHYLALNAKVITVKNNIHLADWQEKLSILKNDQLITEEIIQRNEILNLFGLATKNGDINLMRMLLRFFDISNINVNAQFANGATALYVAAYNGYDQIVNLLLQHKDINVNSATELGATALLVASQNGHDQVVNLLLQHKDINVNSATKPGVTALYLAIQDGHFQIVKALIEHPDTDINKTLYNSIAPIDLALQYAHTNIINLLQDQKEKNEKIKLNI